MGRWRGDRGVGGQGGRDKKGQNESRQIEVKYNRNTVKVYEPEIGEIITLYGNTVRINLCGEVKDKLRGDDTSQADSYVRQLQTVLQRAH